MSSTRPTDSEQPKAGASKLRRPLSLYDVLPAIPRVLTHADLEQKPTPSLCSVPETAQGGQIKAQSPTRLPLSSKSTTSDSQVIHARRKSLLPQPGSVSSIPSPVKPKPTSTLPTGIQRSNSVKGTGISDKRTQVTETVSTAPIENGQKKFPENSRPRVTRERTKTIPGPSLEKSTASQSSLGRSLSLRKPSGSSSRSSPPPRTHSKSLSTSSARIAPRPAASSVQLSSRAPSSSDKNDVPASRASSSPASSDGSMPLTANRRPNPAPSISRLKTPTSVKPAQPRPKAPAASVSSVNSSDATTENVRKAESLPSRAPQLAKPAFSTLQQHFSPKKAVKAPTSTLLAVAGADTKSGSPLSADMASLQSELLQLHVMHSTSQDVLELYQKSAERALSRKFNSVAKDYRGVRDRDREIEEIHNLAALREWSGASSLGLVENVQILSSLLQELTPLVGKDGRFTSLVDTFERWLGEAEAVWRARESGAERAADGSQFVERLGDAWWAESAALVRRLTAMSKEVDSLADASEGSSCGRLVRGCKNMHNGTLEELRSMMAIGREVEGRERAWIEQRLQAIMQELNA